MNVRTEQQMAAQVIVRIINEGVIPTGRTPQTLLRISEATRVPIAAIREAWRHLEAGGTYMAPSPTAGQPVDEPAPVDHQPAPEAAVPEPVPAPAPVRKVEQDRIEKITQAVRRSPRYKAANPAPGKRRCADCGQTKPVEDFPIKHQATGRRRSYCDPCWKARQRSRYVSVQREKALNTVGITLTVTSDDNLTGLTCTGCGQPIVPGDEVHAAGVSFTHTDCDAAAIDAEARAS